MHARANDVHRASDRAEPEAQVSVRAIVIGLAMAVWVTLWPTYTSLILRSTRADYAHLSVALLIPYVSLLALNTLLGRRGRGLRRLNSLPSAAWEWWRRLCRENGSRTIC